MNKRIAMLGLLAVLFGCTPKPNLQEQLIGSWKMEKVLEGEKDVSAEHNPANNRYLELNADGTFETGGDPWGQNTGKWTLDADSAILFIDSSLDDDDSYWYVSMADDRMTWRGKGTPWQENFSLIHVRQ